MIRRRAWHGAPQALGVGGTLISALSDIGAGLTEAGWDDVARQRAEAETVRGMRAGREAVAGDQPLELRGDGTVAGQAFDQAATKSAALAWGNRVRATLDQAVMNNQSDPAGFEQALEGLRATAEDQPGMIRELALADLDDQATRYRGLVQRQAQAKEREAQAAEGLQLADRLGRDAAMAARAGNAAAAVKAAGEHRALLRTLRSDGAISPQHEAAGVARLQGELDEQATLGGFEQAVGAGLDRGQSFIAGWRPPAGVAPDQADTLRRRMQAELGTRAAEAERAQRERERQQEVARRAMVAEVQAAEETIATVGAWQGYEDLVRRAKDVDPALAARLQSAHDGRRWTTGLMAMAPRDAEAEVVRMREAAAAAADPQVGEILAHRAELGERVAKTVRQELEKDPIGWAEAHGVVTPTPLDRPEAYQRRVIAAQAVRERYGVDGVGPLRPHEAEAMAKRFGAAETADAKLDVLTAAVGFWPDEASRRAALAQMVEAKLPAEVGYVYRAALDPRRRAVARQLLSELTGERPKKGDDRPTLTGEADAARDAAAAEAQEVYLDNLGAVRRRQYALTGEEAFLAIAERDLGVTQRVARARATGGLHRPGDSAYADLFGDLAVIDDEDLAHVVYPAGMGEAKVVARGLDRLRAETAPAFLALHAPADPVAGRAYDTAVIEATVRAGVWVNSGDRFVLLVPGTGRALMRPDGQVWSVTPEDAARAGAAP